MWSSWISLCGVCLLTWSAQGTYRHQASVRCECNGKARYCVADALGMRCAGCRGNSSGRHCETCLDGYYQQGAGRSCLPCGCSPTGAAGPLCDRGGRCRCKEGVEGDKCDRCADGSPLKHDGCARSGGLVTVDPAESLPCFCYGHSSECSAAPGYSASNISSTFHHGPAGWRAASAQGVTPPKVIFRWSPQHQDMEVRSEDSMPVYLYAPASFLGDQGRSYGQSLSFSLRLDRGVRHPSTSDVVLEGSGLRVAASLGDLRSIVPCGQKITYTFRLDARPASRWKPVLSAFQFQTLLTNLTALKIRATFGENGRGYLDDVRLGTAWRGRGGGPAGWVQRCVCPEGRSGQSCESCAPGFRRRSPADGPFSACERGSCDPHTGDCYSADESPAVLPCQPGSYSDPARPQAPGKRTSDACQPCDCDPQGAWSSQCSAEGQCPCREGFEGLKCQRSACPSCFSPVQSQMEGYAGRLRELETLFTGVETGRRPVDHAQMERAVGAAERLVLDLQDDAEKLAALERSLQTRLSVISQTQLAEGREVQSASTSADDVARRIQTYQGRASDVQSLIRDARRTLDDAKRNIYTADLPLGDAAAGTDILSSLTQTASSLAQQHQSEAETVERTAHSALADAHKSLALMRSAMSRENKIKELIGHLRTQYEESSAQVEALEDQAARLSSAAREESNTAGNALDQIAALELALPGPLTEETEALAAGVGDLRTQLENVSEVLQENGLGVSEVLQENVQAERAVVEELLAQGKASQQSHDQLLARVNAAQADAELSLQTITDNMDGVDQALARLTGFDDQTSENKALADAAVKKLPGINGTIQRAAGNNSESLFILRTVSEDHSHALDSVHQLDNAVSRLEGASGSLPAHAGGLGRDVAGLRAGLRALRTQAGAVEGALAAEMDHAELHRDRAQEAAMGAAGSYSNAKQSRGAVGDALQTINALLSLIGQPGGVDERRLAELESSMVGARALLSQQLRPRLRELEEREAGQRTLLSGLDQDIHTLLDDIANLEDIRRAVPAGCFNSPPIERP